ncbi:hypothetical protein R1sor_020967 [Riccia sorocarpa]|uniref:C2 domain-containing protein n=1 Tax=Riccia sorocarpa TaxID=122646 RepID=A0ABD3GJD2_9MARC
MPSFIRWLISLRWLRSERHASGDVEPDNLSPSQADEFPANNDEEEDEEDEEAMRRPDHRHRWGKREGQFILHICEALCSWPLFLHLLLILSLVWLTGFLQYNYPLVVFTAIFYLHKVDNVQKERLRIQLQNRMEERRSRLVLSTDAETVVWLNAILQECWPSWLERYLSHLITNCLHLNLAYFKPRALSKLVIDYLRLGSSPPVIQFAKVHRNPNAPRGEQAVLELDISFVAADDMKLEMIARLKRASMGLGLAGKLYGNNLRVEGKLRLGLKFVPFYPYLGQLTVAFASVPVLGLSVRPLSSSSVDVTDLPGIASWVSKAIQAAVETFLVEPNPVVFDMIKLCGADYRFDVDKDGTFLRGNLKEPKDVGFVILEILECKDLEAKDRTGCSDPYVKISMDKVKFKTSVKKQTVHPIWHELFRLRISTWNIPTRVLLRVRDRDAFGKDDDLGSSVIEIDKLRGGKRHDMWLKLRGAKQGEIHVAVTIVDLTGRTSSSCDYEEGSSSQGDAGSTFDRDSCIMIEEQQQGLKARMKHAIFPHLGADLEQGQDSDPTLRKKMKHVKLASVDTDRFEGLFDPNRNPLLERQIHSSARSSALPIVEEKASLRWGEKDMPRKTPKRRAFTFLRRRTSSSPTDREERSLLKCLGGKQSHLSKGRMTLKALCKRMAAEFKHYQEVPAALYEVPIEVPVGSSSSCSLMCGEKPSRENSEGH